MYELLGMAVLQRVAEETFLEEAVQSVKVIDSTVLDGMSAQGR